MTLSQFDRGNIDSLLLDPRNDWFTAQLLRLVRKADSHHRAQLRTGFPEEMALVEAWEREALASQAGAIAEPVDGKPCVNIVQGKGAKHESHQVP